jgi:hypothetical protein
MIKFIIYSLDVWKVRNNNYYFTLELKQHELELKVPAGPNFNLPPVAESPKSKGRWSREGSLSRYGSLSFKMLRSRSKSKTRDDSIEREQAELRRRTTIISDSGNEIYGMNVGVGRLETEICHPTSDREDYSDS